MFSDRLREAVAGSGYSARELAEISGISKRTLDKWISPTQPTMPRADEAAKLAYVLGTTVEELAVEEMVRVVEVVQPTRSATPYQDVIKILNKLPEGRLDDVRRLIRPWANEARGAAQNAIDIVEDLKVLSSAQLEDLRRLVIPWADETRSSSGPTERAPAIGE